MPTGTTTEPDRTKATEACVVQLVVNGEAVSTKSITLAELLDQLGYAETRIATAVNGDFVPAPRRGSVVLADGDKVEIVSARQGG